MTASEAMADCGEFAPSGIVLDIVMPEVDGIEATREILTRNPAATIIMCSALGQEALVIESIAAGARDGSVKPFTPEKWLNVVKNGLKAR